MATACRAVALPFVISRLGILCVGLLAALVIGYDPPPTEQAVWRVAASPLANLLARWDTYWYLDIAARGYHWTGNPLEQQNVVFFPLFPLTMRLLGALIGGHPLVGGLLVSLAAFLAALTYLWRWAADDYGDKVANGVVWLLCAFPFGVYFSAVYTESLFLLTAVGALFHARRGELALTALFGLLAGGVRPNGCLLALPLAWICFVADRPDGPRAAIERAIAVAAPFVGVLSYSSYLHQSFGDALAWVSGQSAWSPIVRPLAALSTEPWPVLVRDGVIQAGNAAALIFALVALVPMTRTLGAACGLFVGVSLAMAVAGHGIQSLGRFTSVLFPLFLWLAVALRERARQRLTVAFAIGQVIGAAMFFSWRPFT